MLYGPHCAVGGCDLPVWGPLNGRGGVYVCNGHLNSYRDRGRGEVQAWLSAAGPLRAQRRSRPLCRLAVGGELEVELRYALQCWHDGQHCVVLGRGRWSSLLSALERVGIGSVLELDPATIREQFGKPW